MSGIFINSDAWNFWLLPENKMNEEGIREDVDFYCSHGGVEAILYNMNFQRSFYDTKVGTPYWKDMEITDDDTLLLRGKPVDEKNDPNTYKIMLKGITLMRKNLPNYMQYRYQYCHEKGVEMWHSMRMNDVHHTPLGLEHRPQHCDLWQERKDLLRAWYRHTWRGDWHDNAFDFGQKEVYNYHINMIREYLLDYESDGIELDWLRSVPIFKPGFDEINTPILTQFMRDTRKAADEAEVKWGHKIRIAARVPLFVDDAMGIGMDVPTWCKEKLIDVLIPGPNNLSTEQYTQVALWRILAPKPVILAPCVDCGISSSHLSHGITCTMETDCGFAAGFYQQGADTIYVYNHFFKGAQARPWMPDFFAIAGDAQAVNAHSRRHIVTRHDPTGEGKFGVGIFPYAIWPKCCNGGVKINAGKDNIGRDAYIIYGTTCPLNVDILLNTVKCEILPADTPLPTLPKRDNPNYVIAKVPDGILHDGWNVVEIFNHDPHTIADYETVWMEIYVK